MRVVGNQREILWFYWSKTHRHCTDISREETVIITVPVIGAAETINHCRQSNGKQ